jgi:hypothetical protein
MALGSVELDAAWQRVLDGWDDPTRHEALMGLVAQESQFAWAAAKYKERAGDAIADKQLERIRKAATASLFASATKKPGEDTPYKRTLVIFIVLIVMLGFLLVGVKLLHDTRPHADDPPAPTTPARH